MIDELDNKATIKMLKEIDLNYSDLNLDIPEPKYDKEGKLLNEKQVKNALKSILAILVVLWNKNNKIIERATKTIIQNNLLYYSQKKLEKKIVKTMLTEKEWNKILNDIVKKRQSKIKIKQVIKGNAKVLNKKVQKTVDTMYRQGKSYKQTAKKLQEEFGYNKAKAKSIAITEKNYYKSEVQLKATEGLKVKKTWIHNGAKDPRPDHVNANGQVAGKDGYFTVGGMKVEAPQHFGIASEDINCHCGLRIEIIE